MTKSIQYNIPGSIYRRNLCVVAISTESMSTNSKKYIGTYVVLLAFDLEIQDQA